MPYKPKETEKLHYSIGEVAKIFNVNTSLIRFWEKEFDILKPYKNKKGDRFFSPKDIDNIRTIFHLVKERGYTLEGARKKMKDAKPEAQYQLEVVKSLQKLKGFLLELKDEMQDTDEIEEKAIVKDEPIMKPIQAEPSPSNSAPSSPENPTPPKATENNQEEWFLF